jgi:predicted dehydrogenase
MNRIGIGIIGCGYWGKNYVRVFHEIAQARVVQVSDLRVDRLQMVQTHYPTIRTTSDFREMLADPAIDAVVVATPAIDHYAVTQACLQAGKHVLVEKPLALSVTEGEHLVTLGQECTKVLMVGHTFLYNAGIRKMKAYIEDGSLGRVYYLHATRTNLGPIRQDVNALWDLAPHDISIFSYLLDATPVRVSAVGARVLGNGREDVGFITLTYPDGVVGNIHVSWVDPNKVRTVVAVGSQKRIVFDDLKTLDRVRVFEKGITAESGETNGFGEFRLLVHDGDIISPRIEPSEPLKNECLHFLDCIQTGAQPLTDSQNGLDVLRIMAAIEKSMRRKGAAVKVDNVA